MAGIWWVILSTFLLELLLSSVHLLAVLSYSWQRGKCILGAKEPEVDWEGGMRMLDSLGQCSWTRLTLTW